MRILSYLQIALAIDWLGDWLSGCMSSTVGYLSFITIKIHI